MRDTGYLPLTKTGAAHIAPTQKMIDRLSQSLHRDLADDAVLQGVVHDPTIRFMGGVGGSAGVFTTVGDLARFARMMLNEGELDGVRVLSRESVRLMSSVQSPSGGEWRRSAGWDIDSPYSRPRGSVFPIGSYGHTGFTGCILWIDPFSKTFFAFLSNRVYPNDKANILELYSKLGMLAAQAVAGFDFRQVDGALAARPAPAASDPATAPPASSR
jgi:CubicO group peptidase (beta-lactamase class C family)